MADDKRAQEDEVVAASAALPDQVGLGIDIVDIDRMRQVIARTKAFATRVFSAAEQEYCESKADPAVHYATRFAAKEAVLKAMGTGFSEGIGPRDIEVKRNAKGQPRAVLSGRAAEVASELGVRSMPLSLSFTHSDAVACAMVITQGNLDVMERRVDPTKELTKRFKEARALLDDVDRLKVGALEREAAANKVDAALVMDRLAESEEMREADGRKESEAGSNAAPDAQDAFEGTIFDAVQHGDAR